MNAQTLASDLLHDELSFFDLPRRILIIGPVDLLVQVVVRMLIVRQDLEVVRIEDNNPSSLALKAAQVHPDVVILCQIDPGLQNHLVASLDGVPALSDLRIIIVHQQNTELNVYQHHHWSSVIHAAFIPLVYGENSDALVEPGWSMGWFL